jgi:NAD+ kinase
VSADFAPRRVVLVVHPSRMLDAALDALAGWAATRGVAVVQLAVPGDGGRRVAPEARAEAGDLVMAVGGDGTVLWALRAGHALRLPVLGVACGSLGVLTSIGVQAVAQALERVWSGDWVARRLPALSVAVDGTRAWAANDLVVFRRGTGQLIAELEVGGERYVRLAGDGVIVATPLGSSAYTMAAGGPLLLAGTPAFVCTPVAMHGGSAPPIVVPAGVGATLTVRPRYEGFSIELDGHQHPLRGERFELGLEPDRLTLVAFEAPGHGLGGLRRRGLIADSPRIVARDRRGDGDAAAEPGA